MKQSSVRTTGNLFGYPNCCIKAFENKTQVKTGDLKGTGFTQCESCNRSVSVLDVIDLIHRNRKIPFVFPFRSNVQNNKLTVTELSNEFKAAFYEYHGKTVDEAAVNPSGNYDLDRQGNIDSQILKVAQVLRDSTTLPLEKIMVKAKVFVSRYNKEPSLREKYTLLGFVKNKILLKPMYGPDPISNKKEPDA